MDPDLDGKFDRAEMDRVVLAATSCINELDEFRPKGSQVLINLKTHQKHVRPQKLFSSAVEWNQCHDIVC